MKTVTFHCTSRACYPPEFKAIMDNNHITGRYIKGLAYRSVGSHSGTFQKSPHSRAPTCYVLNVSRGKVSILIHRRLCRFLKLRKLAQKNLSILVEQSHSVSICLFVCLFLHIDVLQLLQDKQRSTDALTKLQSNKSVFTLRKHLLLKTRYC